MSRIEVPQATLTAIRRAIDACADGARTPSEVESKTGLSARHVSYAIAAGRSLGLVRDHAGDFALTALGRELVTTPEGSDQEASVLASAIAASADLSKIAPSLLGNVAPAVDDMAGRIADRTGLSVSTARHRAAMILKWRDELLNRRIAFPRPVARASRRVHGVLEVRNFAQIQEARIEFGDLTILVGPQATGKSLLLQWFKAALDAPELVAALREAGHDVQTAGNLIDLIFGEGMKAAWNDRTTIQFDSKPVLPSAWTKGIKKRDGRVFFIPAHRALLLVEGWPAPFIKLNADTPAVARLFSQNLYQRFSGRQESALFPVDRILKEQYRLHIDEAIFHGGRVDLQKDGLRYRLRLAYADVELPFMTWTAGQREFTPLLLGLYHVLPPRKSKKLPGVDWVVIEEPEMGLHPQGIAVFMLLVLDLLWRGYRVVISTHSPLILDVVWAIRQLIATKARPQLLSHAFGLDKGGAVRPVMEHALKCDYRVFFMNHHKGRVLSEDISTLDPSSRNEPEAEWGGLTAFSTRFGEAVRLAVNEAEAKAS